MKKKLIVIFTLIFGIIACQNKNSELEKKIEKLEQENAEIRREQEKEKLRQEILKEEAEKKEKSQKSDSSSSNTSTTKKRTTSSTSSSVEQIVRRIRKDYNDTNNYGGYEIISNGGTQSYYLNGDLRKVVVGSGKNSTEYYIKNGQTYFKYSEKYDERYYYNNGNLIRFIDSSKNIYDNINGLSGSYGNEGTAKWEDF